MKKKIPLVAIVGRVNVGKSTLFNRLSESAKSITLDYAGVTRDIITDTVCWRDHCFSLIDTGGLRFGKSEDQIAERVRAKALDTIERADVILFVCDGIIGILPDDRKIAKLLHKLDKKTILVINKIDSHRAQEQRYEFERLGFSTTVSISAQHSIGIADLFDEILSLLPEKLSKAVTQDIGCKVVIVGKPNVGKSSLLNILVKQERAIVADIPGTTREPIKETVHFYQEVIEFADTPGIRRKRGVTESLEKLMVKSAFKAVEDADIVLLVIDASQSRMVDQELKLAFYVFEKKYKGLIILFNKDDLMDEQMRDDLAFALEPYQYFLDKVVQMRISCITNKNVGKLMGIINTVGARYMHRFSNTELTELFKEALQKKPLYRSEQLLRIYYAHQIKTGPITIELVVNEPRWFGPSQCTYLERILRKNADLKGVPVRFVSRKK